MDKDQYIDQLVQASETLNQGWNPELEKLIVNIQEESWAYTWMHNASVNYFNKWNDRLCVCSIGMNVITGTSIFATLNTCSTLLWVQVLTGLIVYAAAIVTGYQQYHRFQERVEKHKLAASKYSNIYHSIKKERGLKPHQRQNAKDYITWITNQYDSLLLTSPEIDDKILEKYYNLYKNRQNQPVIYNYVRTLDTLPITPISEYSKKEGKCSFLFKKKKDKAVDIPMEVVPPVAVSMPAAVDEIPEKKKRKKKKKPDMAAAAAVVADESPISDQNYIREMKDTLKDKYGVHTQDDKLIQYQLDRINQDTVDQINRRRLSRLDFIDPLDRPFAPT